MQHLFPWVEQCEDIGDIEKIPDHKSRPLFLEKRPLFELRSRGNRLKRVQAFQSFQSNLCVLQSSWEKRLKRGRRSSCVHIFSLFFIWCSTSTIFESQSAGNFGTVPRAFYVRIDPGVKAKYSPSLMRALCPTPDTNTFSGKDGQSWKMYLKPLPWSHIRQPKVWHPSRTF